MSEIVVAPWTDEQVTHLNEWQSNGLFHPYTCGHCRDTLGTEYVVEEDGTQRPLTEDEERANNEHYDSVMGREADDPALLIAQLLDKPVKTVHDDRKLVATNNGWICPTCDYIQDWAHAFSAED